MAAAQRSGTSAARAVLSSEEFKDLPPSQIVTRLADRCQYVASESKMYRLLRQTGQLAHRRLEREAQRKVEWIWRTGRLAPYSSPAWHER